MKKKAIELDKKNTSASENSVNETEEIKSSEEQNGELPANTGEENLSDLEKEEEDLEKMNERNTAGEQQKLNPEDLADESVIKCTDFEEADDTYEWTFEFKANVKGKVKKITGICAAPNVERAAWMKITKYIHKLYPTITLTYEQKFSKKKIETEE